MKKNEERHVHKKRKKIWTKRSKQFTKHKTRIRYAQQFKRVKQKANNLKQSHKIINNILPLPHLHYHLSVASGFDVNLTCHFCDRLVKLLFRVDKNAKIFS